MPKAKPTHHHKHSSDASLPLVKSKRFNVPIMVALMSLLALTGVYLVYKSHAANDSLVLTPATANVGLGTNVTVTITENSGTDAVNAVEADLTYDATKLQFVSIDSSSSPFTLQAVSTGGSGTVKIARATTGTTVTGAQLVGTVTFTAIGTGSTPVNFAASSALVRASDTVNVLTIMTGATYTIADTTAPSTPTGLAAPTKTDTSISLSWTASTDNVGVTSYQILRNGAQVGTSATPGFTDTGLTPNTSYSYTVKALDAAGNASTASTALVTSSLPDTTKPSTPGTPTAPSKTVTTINLTWTASTDDVAVTGYRILRNGVQVGTNTVNSFTDTGLTPNTSYTYTIIAVDAAGNASTASTALVSSTLADTTKPTTPTGLASPSKTTTTVSLTWTASTDDVAVTNYQVLRNGVQVGTSATPSFTDVGLTQGTAYSYTVTASDAAGNVSTATAPLVVTTISKPGDVNGDGLVNISDLSILAAHFGQSGQTRSTGDLDGNGAVNIFDLSVLAQYWGT